MKVIKEFKNYNDRTPKVLSLGMFDGVHLGHVSIIHQMQKIAHDKNHVTALLTFWPHPRTIFNPNDDLKLLNTLDEKLALLEKSGIDFLFLKEFDQEFRNLTGEEFIRQILVDTLNVKYIIIGYDHVFGKNKSGNFELLQKLSPELGYEVAKIDAIKEGEFNIGLTRSENESSLKLLREQLARVEGERELLRAELAKMKGYYETKIQEKNALLEKTAQEFAVLCETK